MLRDVGFPRHGFPISHVNRVVNPHLVTVGTPGGQEGLGTIMQGYTEQSNVSVVEEFINLIVAQRGYEANSKVVKAADDMYQQVNNLTR